MARHDRAVLADLGAHRRRVAPAVPLLVAGLALTAPSLMLAGLGDARRSPGSSAYVIFGIGFGLVNAPITNAAVSGMPRAQAGVAAAIASTSRQVGASLGVALAGSLAGGGIAAAHRADFAESTHVVFWLIAGYGRRDPRPGPRLDERAGPRERRAGRGALRFPGDGAFGGGQVTRASKNDRDRTWQQLVALVMDSRWDWRRKMSDAAGLPFSRVRALDGLTPCCSMLRALAGLIGMGRAGGYCPRRPISRSVGSACVQLNPEEKAREVRVATSSRLKGARARSAAVTDEGQHRHCSRG